MRQPACHDMDKEFRLLFYLPTAALLSLQADEAVVVRRLAFFELMPGRVLEAAACVARLAEIKFRALFATVPGSFQVLFASIAKSVGWGVEDVVQEHHRGMLCPPYLIKLVRLALTGEEQLLPFVEVRA